MLLRFRISPVLVAIAMLSTASSEAAERHVSPSGLDTNPGTAELPWRSVQKAANTAAPGDIVNVHAGNYAERVAVTNRDGITFRKFPGDAGAAVITQSGVTPPNDLSAIFKIEGCDQVFLQDLEIANYKTSGNAAQQRAQLPVGIYISGACDGVRILNCKVHDIWQSSPTANNYDANAFGIAVYGDAATPVDHLVIDGCEIYGLRTGASESVVLNGNVTNFAVTNNTVHDCNNIGIDFIGFEGANSNAALDQARNGVCSANTVYRIDSKFNPVYGGSFPPGSGGSNDTRSAPGIYVDGGKDIVIERNHVFDCNYGLSAGSEHQNKVVSNVTVRDNLFHHCHVGGIVIGGSETTNGGVTNSSFTHNTLYENDTVAQGGGQFSIQNHTSSIVIRHNLMVATAPFAQFILKGNTTGSIAAGAIDWNLYKTAAASEIEFIWNNAAKSTFATWQSASGDAHSTLITAPLALVNAAPTVASSATDFALSASSPAKDAGDPAFTAATGEKDYFGQGRTAGGRVDIGADEYLSALQSWRDSYFALPDGGPGTASSDDPDHDGVANLIEYSQGMDPTRSDTLLLPSVVVTPPLLRFTYRKSAAELTYLAQASADLTDWSLPLPAEQAGAAGTYFRDFPIIAGERRFVRLEVTSPVAW